MKGCLLIGFFTIGAGIARLKPLSNTGFAINCVTVFALFRENYNVLAD